MTKQVLCPLCHSDEHQLFCAHETGEYRLCSHCQLVFVLPESHLDALEEKGRYDLHTNSPDDEGYRAYLKKFLDPVNQHLTPHSHGLDFGSGPGPTLSIMFEEAGHSMRIYDHFYAKDEGVWDECYDFITSTEVIEHLYTPSEVFMRLWKVLKEGGVLALLTQPYPEQDSFETWYYKNDPTHVCFFSEATFTWLASYLDARLEIVKKDLFILRKNPS